MFEHVANWRPLLERVRSWLRPGGLLFFHVFTHRSAPYRFDQSDKEDWIAQHFFTGGIMPSEALIREFADLFTVEASCRWSGTHYARTAEDWLRNFDRNVRTIDVMLKRTYGADAVLWRHRSDTVGKTPRLGARSGLAAKYFLALAGREGCP
jgi:cyclopropane-fatty-acyl-phospholipid synthase